MTRQLPEPVPPPNFGDRYDVGGILGRGGMATVWRAHDRILGRDVAIKALDTGMSASIDRDRFLQEVRVTARLVHPAILPLFDSGSVDDTLFYVMPLVRGMTLRARLEQDQRLPVAEAVGLVSDIAEALAYAHGEGIVHRDLKPENVFCHERRALLADFGVAHAMKSSDVTVTGDQRLTTAGMIIGTPLYFAPEQALGDARIDGRADLYALGCLLYELLTGAPPFRGANAMALMAQHVTVTAPDVLVACPEAGARLAAITARLMAKDPAERYPSASAFMAALRQTDAEPAAVSTPVLGSADRIADPVARNAYISGRDYWMRSMHGGADTRHKLLTAKAYLERALHVDPANPTILAALSDCIIVMGMRGFMPLTDARDQANSMLYDALAHGEPTGLVHGSLGVMLMYQSDDFEMAGTELKLARELDPNDGMLRRQYGNWLKMAGRIDDALIEMRAALALDPRAPFFQLGLGDCLIAAGRNDEAVDPLRDALRLASSFTSALERLELACHRAGRHTEAAAARATLHSLRNKPERATQLEQDVATIGWTAARTADVRRDLDELLAQAATADPFVEHGSRQAADAIIVAHAELGEWTPSMDWVERGYHQRPGRLRRVLTDLLFDRRGLAIDPRYASMLRNAGLEALL